MTGFSTLNNNGFNRSIFTISCCDSSDEHLPQVHTCSFQLNLPPYSNKNQLIKKMDLALQEKNFGVI